MRVGAEGNSSTESWAGFHKQKMSKEALALELYAQLLIASIILDASCNLFCQT